MFVDEALITVRSGHGGHGAVSFRREKYIPRGGPDGGDGGRGGDVRVTVRRNVKTLADYRSRHHFIAANGQPGSGRQRTGRDGRQVELIVPPGTVIRDAETGELLADMTKDGDTRVLLEGGRGGKGNTHFKTSRHQTPRFAQPGEDGQELRVQIELQLIADVGFVGLPNAGKSTLLKALTAADPKVGSYPFTTIIPNLGVLRVYQEDIVLADIPGIIRGASEGAGLGFRFLKHVARTKGIAFVLDVSDDPEGAYETLLAELTIYGHGLAAKPAILLASKSDLDPGSENIERFRKAYPDKNIVSLSAAARMNLDTVKQALFTLATSGRQDAEP